MTTATGSAEFLKKDDLHRVTIETGRKLWSLHGMTHRILEKLGVAESKALALADRGPDPDYAEGAESEFERGMRAGIRFGGYREAPKGDGSLKAIIIGCTITILSAFVIGAWKLSNDSAAIRAEFTEWKQATTRWMDQNERRLDRLESRRP
jgi:hypothetical protein